MKSYVFIDGLSFNNKKSLVCTFKPSNPVRIVIVNVSDTLDFITDMSLLSPILNEVDLGKDYLIRD
jgi:hypothetical protein